MGYIFSALLVVSVVGYFAYAILSRLRKRRRWVNPEFAPAWKEHHIDELMPPPGVFEQWYDDWLETGIKPADWIERHVNRP